MQEIKKTRKQNKSPGLFKKNVYYCLMNFDCKELLPEKA